MITFKLTEEQSQIVEDNHNLIYGFAHHRGLDVNKWYGKLAIELCKSVIHWNSDRGSLSTYYYLRADTMLLLDYRKRNTQKRKANESVTELDLDIVYDDYESVTESVILDELYKFGDRKILRMRYEGYSQEEIANELGVTQPTISRMLDRTLERYREGSEINH